LHSALQTPSFRDSPRSVTGAALQQRHRRIFSRRLKKQMRTRILFSSIFTGDRNMTKSHIQDRKNQHMPWLMSAQMLSSVTMHMFYQKWNNIKMELFFTDWAILSLTRAGPERRIVRLSSMIC